MNLISALLLTAVLVPVQEPTDYKTAYDKAQAGDRPLLVLVTADWCPPCQRMKSTTMPELLSREAFEGVHYATVDYDKDAELAKQLIGDRGVPQLLMFEKQEGKWVRRYMTGYKTADVVEAFIAQSSTAIRTASAESTNNK
jgi:thiol:disulfide interchange protein